MKKVKNGIYGSVGSPLWVHDNMVVNGDWEVLYIDDDHITCKLYPGRPIPYLCKAIRGKSYNYNDVIEASLEAYRIEESGQNYAI
jgi:hypothetical protein